MKSIWRFLTRTMTGTRVPAAGTPVSGIPGSNKFEMRPPSTQNAIDLFQGRWASDLSDVIPGAIAGSASHFRNDPRPGFTLRHFSGPDGTLKGALILDIGPLEGGHAYLLEQLGAEKIIAVEANSEAFLKCLIAKNILGMNRTQFLLGDILEYLRADHQRFDLIFCSGVLYHMEDPVELIHLMAQNTDRIFLWTHYYTAETNPALTPYSVMRQNAQFEYFRRHNDDRGKERFWGGNRLTASWLRREDIFRAFAGCGFTGFDVHEENPDHPGGPCLSASFWRPDAMTVGG